MAAMANAPDLCTRRLVLSSVSRILLLLRLAGADRFQGLRALPSVSTLRATWHGRRCFYETLRNEPTAGPLTLVRRCRALQAQVAWAIQLHCCAEVLPGRLSAAKI